MKQKITWGQYSVMVVAEPGSEICGDEIVTISYDSVTHTTCSTFSDGKYRVRVSGIAQPLYFEDRAAAFDFATTLQSRANLFSRRANT